MIIKDYIGALDNAEVKGDINAEFSHIGYDSRKISKGGLFVAIRGSASDGHKFIPQVIEKGASVIICEEIPAPSGGVAFIKVKNSRKALAALSHAFYNHPTEKMLTFGVTGTNGKTTITFLLKSILESAGFKCGMTGTTGNYIGKEFIPATHTTPESLELACLFDRMIKEGVNAAVMEVSSHALHQGRADKIDFDGAIFTNLSHDHLDYHHTFEDYAAAKRLLFQSLKSDSAAVVNFDDNYCGFMLEGCPAKKRIKVGRGLKADVRITNEKHELNGTKFSLASENTDYNIDLEINLPGAFNVENAAFSAILALSHGIEKIYVADGLKTSKGAPGRMQKVCLPHGATAIVDYAHTPDALEKALKASRQYLEDTGSKGSLICVFGCGGDRDAGKRPEMGAIAANLSDMVIITNDNPRTENPDKIIEDIYKGIPNDKLGIVLTEKIREAAIEKAVLASKENDLILVAGKGHENYQIIGTERFHSDDVEILQKYC